MLAIQSKQRLSSNKVGANGSGLERTTGKAIGATVIELGIALAGAESRPPIPGSCSRCRSYRNPLNSTAQCPNVFCSEQCEQEFVHAALASLTVEDCIRMHERLETLLMRVEKLALYDTAASKLGADLGGTSDNEM